MSSDKPLVEVEVADPMAGDTEPSIRYTTRNRVAPGMSQGGHVSAETARALITALRYGLQMIEERKPKKPKDDVPRCEDDGWVLEASEDATGKILSCPRLRCGFVWEVPGQATEEQWNKAWEAGRV
ncbi:hypothetical protein ACIBCT_35385 [Streptosporangium sp. NPDC050855]|uniref:hypothetical protein n=1 Tax=Streptosporangium sp. NPDC050855 TaxID=3366194 RepID=UPI0037A83A54